MDEVVEPRSDVVENVSDNQGEWIFGNGGDHRPYSEIELVRSLRVYLMDNGVSIRIDPPHDEFVQVLEVMLSPLKLE